MAKRRQPAKEGAPRLSRILVPTDFSAGAEAALAWAMRLANLFRTQVTILYVLDPSLGAIAGLPAHYASMPAYGELLETVRRESKSEMEKIAKRYPKSKTVIREGSPRSVILDAAAGAGLIVMGTHGRTGLAHVFFGSVAEHVVRHSRIPVLTVRAGRTGRR
jgi:nucleotide-binding universal stress UspA family protein